MTLPTNASMNAIFHTLLQAIILVLIVVYVFLHSFRATIIPMLTIPVSLLGGFIAFPMLGISVNTLEAAIKGANLRLRPILMTSFAFISAACSRC